MSEIRSIGKLCFLLRLKKEYLFELAGRADGCYHSYDKKTISQNGTVKTRHINSPNTELKEVQKRINCAILKPAVDDLPGYVHGSRRGKGVTTNAEVHVGKEAILFLDIHDCFPSISAQHVYYVYRNLLHCSDKVASILVKLTTKDHALPQGCPTSTNLCNLALAHMLGNMARTEQELGLDMSQYVDDIFYSGEYEKVCKAIRPALRAIGQAGLRPNKKKVRIGKNGHSLQVTGVTVNVKLSAGRTRIRKVERKILRITAEDKCDYNNTIKQRKMQLKTGQKMHSKTCKVEQLLGEISNITSINKQQGSRLKEKLEKRLKGI